MPAPARRNRSRWYVEDRVGTEGTIEVRVLRGLGTDTVDVQYVTGRLRGIEDQIHAADLLVERVPLDGGDA